MIDKVKSNTLNFFREVYYLYYDGFRSMTVGRKLWIIILLKLVILILVMKIFFFPDLLRSKYDTDGERRDHVLKELTSPGK
jgi:uncharacterized membrane protein